MRTKGIIYIGGLAVLALMGAILLRARRPATSVSTEPTPAVVATTTRGTEAATTETLPMALLGSRRAPVPAEASSAVKTSAGASLVSECMNLSGDLWRRQQAVRALPHDLTREDQETLIKFLKERHAEDDGQGGHVLKNDLMDALLAQESVWPELAEVFTAIYRDASQHLVIRDYALQHLSLLSERLNEPGQGGEASQALWQRQQIQQVLWEATVEDSLSMAGTALLGLARLSDSDATVDRRRLAATAQKIATSEVGSNEAARVSAIQVCARLGDATALPVLVQAARREQSPLVRISAIGALGMLGGKNEVPLLQEFEAETEPRLKHVAEMALRRLERRAGGNL